MRLKALLLLSGITGLIHTSPLLAQDEFRPENAPRKEKHRNQLDELGHKQGLWMVYNYMGDKQEETEYKNDKKEGISRRFYTADKVKEEMSFIDGKKDGEYKKYFFTGEVSVSGNYNNGKKDGVWTKYYENGQVKSEGLYKKGVQDGVWKFYNKKGELTQTAEFRNGSDISKLPREDLAAKAPSKNNQSANKPVKK